MKIINKTINRDKLYETKFQFADGVILILLEKKLRRAFPFLLIKKQHLAKKKYLGSVLACTAILTVCMGWEKGTNGNANINLIYIHSTSIYFSGFRMS